VVVGALIVLICTQLTRVLVGGAHGPYVWTLFLAAVGFLGAEAVAMAVRIGGPMLGPLHPVMDVAAIALVECAGAIAVLPLTRRRRGP